MTDADWLRLGALALCAILILPATLRLPWRSGRILLLAAVWLAVFVLASLAWRLAGG